MVWPFKEKRSPLARTYVAPTGAPRSIPELLAARSALRRRATTHTPYETLPAKGMWVVYDGRIGILRDLGLEDVADVMLVNEDRTNALEVHVPAASLRQAWLEEIPLASRPDAVTGAAAGYHPRPV